MSYSSSPRSYSPLFFYAIVSILVLIAVSTSCGSNGSSSGGGGSKFSGNTSVNVVLSSTANDQLNRFDIQLQTLSLTDQSGKSVNVVSTDQGLEFIHLNGGIEPLLTVSVPQGIYTAATASVGTAEFTCVTMTPSGSLDTSIFGYGQTPANSVTVNLPSPLTITGTNMTLALNMNVLQSAAYSACYDPNSQYTYTISPTFDLTAVSLAAQPTSAANGKVSAMDGKVTSIDTTNNSFQLTLPQDLYYAAPAITIKTGSGASYQGINGFSDLTVGTLLELDGALQADGSMSATRIAVLDSDTTNLSAQTGPVMQSISSVSLASVFDRQAQGYFYDTKQAAIWMPFDYQNAQFQISGQFSNLQSLPFVPSFTAANMVAGQNVYATSHALHVTGNPYTPATLMTLIPQAVNGTVIGSSTSGSFTVYSISLASYNMFPALANQAGQPILLNNPSEVEVYVDANTQELNKTSLAPGNTLRFYGLVFNDNGTLRMDCGQVNDGVAFTPGPASRGVVKAGKVQSVTRGSNGSVRQVIVPVMQ